MNYKLGSLFDGSGGFPLAGALCGIEPVWAAEVEPYPIAVTRSRFQKMRHLGDISKVNGAEIEPVDIITFGSPCQDLSVAGKRAGLKHEANGDEETTRSGLFMEAVRIIKEMRKATNGQYPTFALWENVPGAFSSNKGEDFRIVCEELIKIVEPSATMPEVPQKGWNYADSYVGDGWSLAYRVLDAQYWGVPQRRRRIYLVADFRGGRAREILFEREGLRGYFTQGRTPWQTAPANAERGIGTDDREGEGFDGYNGDLTGDKSATLGVNCGLSTGRNGVIERGDRGLDGVAYTLKIRSGCEGGGKGALVQRDKSATLATNNDQYLFQPKEQKDVPEPIIYTRSYGGSVTLDGITPTLEARAGTGGNNQPIVTYSEPVLCLQGNGINRADTAGCNGKGWKEDTSYTLNTIDRPAVVFAVDQGGGKSSANVTENKAPTLCTTHGGEPAVAYGLDRASFNQGQNAKFDFAVTEESQPTLTARGPGAVCTVGLNGSDICPTLISRMSSAVGTTQDDLIISEKRRDTRYIVRRLTPTECARLQGFADRWGDVDAVDKFSQKDYQFWMKVRNTHARINGKKEQEYTVKQMLTWYNKLQTDSAEYKMWGNGIALPTALYVLQGITDALDAAEMIADELNGAEELIEDWML